MKLEVVLVAEPGQVIARVSPALGAALEMVQFCAPRSLADAALAAFQVQPPHEVGVQVALVRSKVG